jgi:sarcosine oxidase subunit gamma
MASVGRVSGGAAHLATEPFLAQIDLRLDPALADRVPFPLPLEPGTAREDGPRAALWLGPDAWLVLGPPGEGTAIVSELDAALRGLHRSVVDVSANRVALALTGRGRFELLASGCSLDLHPRAWWPGRCAGSLYAGVPIVVHERAGGTTRVLVRPSYAAHLIDRLQDAAAGLGGTGATALP